MAWFLHFEEAEGHDMIRLLLSVALAGTGLYLGWSGRGIWKDSPDELWALVTVNCVLWSLAIAFESTISRLLRPFLGTPVRPRRL